MLVPVGVGEGDGGAVDRVGDGAGACVGGWVWLGVGAGMAEAGGAGLAGWVTGATAGAVPTPDVPVGVGAADAVCRTAG